MPLFSFPIHHFPAAEAAGLAAVAATQAAARTGSDGRFRAFGV